jgi:putative ABC transport system substrate-binding protein
LPIVFAQVSDPVAAGLVASPARPGGNVTGFALYEYGFAAKWGEVLREIAPRTVRIGVIYDPANAMQRQLPHLERTLSPGVQVFPLSVSSRSDLENAIEQIASEPNGALIVFAGPLAVAHRDLGREPINAPGGRLARVRCAPDSRRIVAWQRSDAMAKS